MNKFNRNKRDWFWFEIRLMFVLFVFSCLVYVDLGKLDNVLDNQQTIIEMQTSGMKTVLRIEDELAQMRSELCQPWEQKTKP